MRDIRLMCVIFSELDLRKMFENAESGEFICRY